MSQKILKSGAAVSIEASRAATSWETTAPLGLAYVGTTQMPLMLGSVAASCATASASGPSSFIGTVTMSIPNQFEQREVPVVARDRADEGDLLLLAPGPLAVDAALEPQVGEHLAHHHQAGVAAGDDLLGLDPQQLGEHLAQLALMPSQPAVVAHVDPVRRP